MSLLDSVYGASQSMAAELAKKASSEKTLSTQAQAAEPSASASLSSSSDVFSAVDDFFNLSSSDRLGAYGKLSPEDKESFLKIVAKLGSEGFMGYEVYKDKNGQTHKEDVTLSIADTPEERKGRKYLTEEETESV